MLNHSLPIPFVDTAAFFLRMKLVVMLFIRIHTFICVMQSEPQILHIILISSTYCKYKIIVFPVTFLSFSAFSFSSSPVTLVSITTNSSPPARNIS